MKAEFIAVEGVLKGLILSLERGDEWTLGRDPDLSTLVIEDPHASRRHLRIQKTDEGYVVENLSDKNPAMIGDQVIEVPTLLHDGDELKIGGSLFRFHEEGVPFDYGFESDIREDEDEEKEPEHLIADEEDKDDVFEEPKSSFEEEEKLPEEEEIYEEPISSHIDLTPSSRFIIKVIAGPNTGAEFALDQDRSYLIGTDTSICDIVFNDLSVSREHARLSVSGDGKTTIHDLNSRNGVIVDKERIFGAKVLDPNSVVTLGTSAFLLIDKEAPSETIVTPLYEAPEKEEEAFDEQEEEFAAKPAGAAAAVARPKKAFPVGALVLSLIICGLAVLLGIGMVSLLQTKDVSMEQKDTLAELQNIINKYPAVKFTYNKGSNKLFLMGHVRTGVEHNELLYQLRGIGFLSIDDNIINDEAVWQEMNILLSKHPEFKGVSMHSPEAGVFVITGYLQTEKQAADLVDYLNVNFNYLGNLQNNVVVEQSVSDEVSSRLAQNGFTGVTSSLSNGELQLTGYISTTDVFSFDKLLDDLKKIPGVRNVRSFVVPVTPEQGVIDLNRKYQSKQQGPPRFRVTGYSRHGDVNVNVVVNGRLISRGDCIEGYTVTGIQPHSIFLEKDGLKYKIEYNKCKSFGMEDCENVWNGERQKKEKSR